MNAGGGERDPDCRRCRHHFVTYHPATPRGCRAFGFETADSPAAAVRLSSGRACPCFVERPRPASEAGEPPLPPEGPGAARPGGREWRA